MLGFHRFLDFLNILAIMFLFVVLQTTYGHSLVSRLVVLLIVLVMLVILPKEQTKLFLNSYIVELLAWSLLVIIYYDRFIYFNFSLSEIARSFKSSSILYLFYLFIMFPICEEILFRIIPLYNVNNKKTFIIKSTIYSLLFALVHFNYNQLLSLLAFKKFLILKFIAHFLFSISLSIFFIKYKSPKRNILIHSAVNIFSFIL